MANATAQKGRFGLPGWMTGFGAQVIAGLIIGLILGLVARGMDSGAAEGETSWLTGLLSGVGSAYVSLLKVMVPPLVFAAVVTSVAKLREVANAARLAVSTLVWFAITAFFSVLAGIAVAFVATIYGLVVANLVTIPYSTRAKRKYAHIFTSMELMIEGILSIQAGESPALIERKLECYIVDKKEKKEGKA